MKVWMWQRLYKKSGDGIVRYLMLPTYAWEEVKLSPGFIWLCPKPNLVLVDRKHLGDME